MPSNSLLFSFRSVVVSSYLSFHGFHRFLVFLENLKQILFKADLSYLNLFSNHSSEYLIFILLLIVLRLIFLGPDATRSWNLLPKDNWWGLLDSLTMIGMLLGFFSYILSWGSAKCKLMSPVQWLNRFKAVRRKSEAQIDSRFVVSSLYLVNPALPRVNSCYLTFPVLHLNCRWN